MRKKKQTNGRNNETLTKRLWVGAVVGRAEGWCDLNDCQFSARVLSDRFERATKRSVESESPFAERWEGVRAQRRRDAHSVRRRSRSATVWFGSVRFGWIRFERGRASSRFGSGANVAQRRSESVKSRERGWETREQEANACELNSTHHQQLSVFIVLPQQDRRLVRFVLEGGADVVIRLKQKCSEMKSRRREKMSLLFLTAALSSD